MYTSPRAHLVIRLNGYVSPTFRNFLFNNRTELSLPIGISSTCWDSIAEVTALAVNSPPTAALRNTCAGITELHIFKLPVRVLVAKDEEGEGEHLELVFGNVDQEQIKDNTIKANLAYGTMPCSTIERKKTR